MKHASAATPVMAAATATSVAGSFGSTSKSNVAINRVSASAPARPAAKPEQRQAEALAHDVSHHRAALRAERHADADLPAPLRDHVREETVGADRREQQREPGEPAKQLRQQARAAHRLAEDPSIVRNLMTGSDGSNSRTLPRSRSRASRSAARVRRTKFMVAGALPDVGGQLAN